MPSSSHCAEVCLPKENIKYVKKHSTMLKEGLKIIFITEKKEIWSKIILTSLLLSKGSRYHERTVFG